MQRFMIEQAENAVKTILLKTKPLNTLAFVGVPVMLDGALYNCVAALYRGEILGIVPKVNLSSSESRCFSSGKDVHRNIKYADKDTVLSPKLVLSCNQLSDLKIGVEIGTDLFAPITVSEQLVVNGNASVIVNPSAIAEYVGISKYKREAIISISDKLCCAYLSAGCGVSESSTDCVYSGRRIICEKANILAESELFTDGISYADIDLQKLCYERTKKSMFSADKKDVCYVDFDITVKQVKLERKFSKTPFVLEDKALMDERCEGVLNIQSHALATRMKNTAIEHLVLGLSGGLDSTLAMIVSIKALDILGLDHKNLHCYSMPCFGTTQRTKSNAEKLAVLSGVDFDTINITNTVKSHFADIKHTKNKLDATYENAQARVRTLVLMDMANKLGGLVVGTGDLSELALGWATYNGDHMSMYAVNASIPKTVVKTLVEYVAQNSTSEVSAVLKDILATPVSPELLPPDANNNIAQFTEDLVGPYELHDFFLYCFLKHGFTPEKIFYVALNAFKDVYDRYTIKKWMQKFFIRFFTQQFKRSCMPDGVRVGSVSLSPRGDFSMPSDVQFKMWIDRINEL